VIFTTIFHRYDYKVDESTVIFEQSGITDYTIGQIKNQLPKVIEMNLISSYGYTTCANVTLQAVYEWREFNISVTAENDYGTVIRCSYYLSSNTEYQEFLEVIKNEKAVQPKVLPNIGLKLDYYVVANSLDV
jgi:hypothetical protein